MNYIDYKYFYTSKTNSSKLRKELVDSVKDSVNRRCNWLSSLLIERKEAREAFIQLYNSKAHALKAIERKRFTVHFCDMPKITSFIQDLDDRNYNEIWAGSCFTFQLPWAVNLFLLYYGDIEELSYRSCVDQFFTDHPWDPSPEEILYVRLREFCFSHPHMVNNPQFTEFGYIPSLIEYCNAATTFDEHKFAEFIKSKGDFRTEKVLLLAYLMHVPMDYLLRKDYLYCNTWYYALFQDQYGTISLLDNIFSLFEDFDPDVVCHFCSLAPKDQRKLLWLSSMIYIGRIFEDEIEDAFNGTLFENTPDSD